MIGEVGLFWLLLPISAAASFYFARRGSAKLSDREVARLRRTYFRGLNYLLNEQSDKAIEVFQQIAQVDDGTIETHLALGNLFRRRGEVDRAIRVHQTLIQRPTLSPELKTAAQLELGEDYMRAGLLDRAETLFSDLVANDVGAPSALRHLVSIYQQERDWHKAIDHARRLERATGDSQGGLIAQFYCELAEHARVRRDFDGATRLIAEARSADPRCARATLIEARAAADAGDFDKAVASIQQVIDEDPDFVPLLLEPALNVLGRRSTPQAMEDFLGHLMQRYGGISPILAMTRWMEARHGEQAAADFLGEKLRTRPSVRGLAALIDLNLKTVEGGARDSLLTLKELTRKLLEGQAAFRCNRCGFGARSHHWQCPSCKSWGTVKPVHGVVGD